MVKASAGTRRGTRRKFKEHFRQKFKSESYLKEFKAHERIIIRPLPSSHRGIPHIRFQGKEGEIIGREGEFYIVRVRIGDKQKQVTLPPEHISKK